MAPHHFGSVQLVDGAVLTHSANTTTQTHELDLTVTDQVIVDATSRIDVTGKGYLAGYTSGNTTVGGATGATGGSHGGLGGIARSPPTTTMPTRRLGRRRRPGLRRRAGPARRAEPGLWTGRSWRPEAAPETSKGPAPAAAFSFR